MNEAPTLKRRWFQLHLSTCVVLMFVSGALVWANVRERSRFKSVEEIIEAVEYLDSLPPEDYVFTLGITRGWPVDACLEEYQGAWMGKTLHYGPSQYFGWRLAFNVLAAFAILAVTAFACEWRARRTHEPARE